MCMNALQVSTQTSWQAEWLLDRHAELQIGRLQIINRQAGLMLNSEVERADSHSGQKHDDPTPNEL